MKIAIDIDEVLADFSRGLVDYFYKKHRIKLMNYRGGNTYWWQAWGHTKEGAIGRVYEFIHSAAIMDVKPIEGSVEGAKALKGAGHDLVVVTSRPIAIMNKTWAWLETHYQGIFRRAYSTDFHLINKNYENKGDICAHKEVDLLIDDYLEFCEEARSRGVKALLYTTQWNKNDKLPDGIKRVNNWREIIKYINTREQYIC